jgi:hypothetical protein
MNRRKFALAVYLLLFAATGFAGLSSCGGGSGGEVMITPAGNRAPVVAQAFADITINMGRAARLNGRLENSAPTSPIPTAAP